MHQLPPSGAAPRPSASALSALPSVPGEAADSPSPLPGLQWPGPAGRTCAETSACQCSPAAADPPGRPGPRHAPAPAHDRGASTHSKTGTLPCRPAWAATTAAVAHAGRRRSRRKRPPFSGSLRGRHPSQPRSSAPAALLCRPGQQCTGRGLRLKQRLLQAGAHSCPPLRAWANPPRPDACNWAGARRTSGAAAAPSCWPELHLPKLYPCV